MDFQGEVLVEAGEYFKKYQFNNTEIQKVIENFEKNTSVEIVTMVVGSSDIYPAIKPRITIVAFISLLFFSYSLNLFSQLEYRIILLLLIISFFISFIVSKIEILASNFVFPNEINEEVRQRAIEGFFEHNLHNLNAGAILLFISLFEKKVDVLYDEKIKETIDQKEWLSVINNMLPEIKKKNLTRAFSKGIETSLSIVKEKFPPNTQQKNELSNETIIES